MGSESLIAVLTGDVVKSKELSGHRQVVMDGLRHAVEKAQGYLAAKGCRLLFSGYYRGDAFQCALTDPRHSLWTAAFLRAELIFIRGKGENTDIRLGLGLGSASDLNENNISASDGEAFRLSGKALDSLKSAKEKYRRLLILSPWHGQNDLLAAMAALMDALIQRWTQVQAEAVSLFLMDKSQEEISRALGISQPAVQNRLERAGHFAVKEALDHYSRVIETHLINPNAYNPSL